MRKLIGAAFVSLDGVMQAPGGPTEDPTGDFKLGGWLAHYFDKAVGSRIDALFAGPFDLLLGRRTYDIFAAYWPFIKDGENAVIGERFGRAAKYVVTRGEQPLPWQNSHRLASIDAVAELKHDDGPNLVIQGSGTLYPQLLAAGLIDRLTLMIFPVILVRGNDCSAMARRRARCGWWSTRLRRTATSSRPMKPPAMSSPAAFRRSSRVGPNLRGAIGLRRAHGDRLQDRSKW